MFIEFFYTYFLLFSFSIYDSCYVMLYEHEIYSAAFCVGKYAVAFILCALLNVRLFCAGSCYAFVAAVNHGRMGTAYGNFIILRSVLGTVSL